jgi:hypothetical protein
MHSHWQPSINLEDLNCLATEAAEDELHCSTVAILWTLKACNSQIALDRKMQNITWKMARSQALSLPTCCKSCGLSLSWLMDEESVNFSVYCTR